MTARYEVFLGGLLRCCLATLEETMATRATLPVDGEKLRCRYCKNGMIFSASAWRWDQPPNDVYTGTGT